MDRETVDRIRWPLNLRPLYEFYLWSHWGDDLQYCLEKIYYCMTFCKISVYVNALIAILKRLTVHWFNDQWYKICNKNQAWITSGLLKRLLSDIRKWKKFTRSGVRTHAGMPPLELKSNALTTRPSWWWPPTTKERLISGLHVDFSCIERYRENSGSIRLNLLNT